VRVRAALRDPGAALGTPGAGGAADPERPAVAAAVSPAGDAVVAWVQGRAARHRVVAARRRAGGAFGSVEPLTAWRRSDDLVGAGGSVAAAMSAAGVATVAWALPRPDRRHAPLLATVGTAHAPPGGRFAHQAIAPTAQEVSRVALAVAPDGWALLAYDDTDGVHALERAPGAGVFTEAFVDSSDKEVVDAGMPVVAVRDGGGGLVAWRSSLFEPRAAVLATTRPASGAFPAPRTVAPDTSNAGSGFGAGAVVVGFAGGSDGPVDLDGGALGAALTPDGRTLLAWAGERNAVARAAVASGTLATGFAAPVTLSGPLRDVDGVAPLLLADGRTAVAWTDNATSFGIPVGQGRLHLAVESSPALPDPARPRITVRAPRLQRLYDSQPVRLRVRCDRACDVRAMLAGAGDLADVEAHSLRRAGTLPFDLARVERTGDRHRVRIRVRAGGPNARDVVSASRRVLVVRRPPLPVPRVLDVRAVRRGGSIVVTWRTEFPARRTIFAAFGQRTRKLGPDAIPDLGSIATVRGRGRTHFRARLRPDRPEALRWVGVYAYSVDRTRGHRALVRLD
jgi:hypothetical protein